MIAFGTRSQIAHRKHAFALTVCSANCYIQSLYMQSGGARVRLRRMAAALAVCCLGLTVVGGGPVASAQAPAEVRALWVLRTSLTSPRPSPRSCTPRGNTASTHCSFRCGAAATPTTAATLEPRAADLIRQPASFDPLDTVVREAHDAGLRVHAWINLNLVSSAAELPASRDHLIYRHPEWLMVPREIAQDVARLDPTSPAYIGKLARWTRAQADKVEGLYASPLQPDAAKYAESIVGDIARRYEVDGIHLDYVRYPNDQFDYSRYAIAEFRAEIRPAWRRRSALRSMRSRRSICSPIRIVFLPSGKAFVAPD